ncbi:SDR family NAD(P)-dependent oxidoreductase [Nocardioides sp. R1-1]|uniref:SDR family NAD(P)-dependent oxidoreductase n=1 Tax=Nocardioides sp. R1-1 TaxID=3383502 RepID=UPI0038D0D35B
MTQDPARGTAQDGTPVSIVTGGATGIGGAISRALATRGDHVVLNDIDVTAAAETATAIRTDGGSCTVVEGDVTDDGVVAAVVEAAVAVRGVVDHLVNNVGDFRPASRDFAHSTPAQWQRLYELNLRHVLAMSHAVLPYVVAGSSIVNVSTVEAFRGIPASAPYSAFKAGVAAFTKSLAVELGPRGVRVNAIAPDLTDTAQTSRAAMLRGRDEELVPLWLPLGRFAEAEDHARVVTFLTSDDARFVTGHTIPVDGGTLAASGWYRRHDGKGWTNMPDRP